MKSQFDVKSGMFNILIVYIVFVFIISHYLENVLLLAVISIVLLLSICNANGQVKHNYPMSSNQTNCDTLHLDSIGHEKILSVLDQTSFRYRQEFKLTRKQGLRSAVFYSCDNKSGFLVVVIDDKKSIFRNVPIDIWKEFSKSSDPEGYYFEIVLKKYMKNGR